MLLNDDGAKRYRDALVDLKSNGPELRKKEEEFVDSILQMLARGERNFTKAQMDWLDRLIERASGLGEKFTKVTVYSYDYYVAKTWAINKPKRRK